MKKSKRFCHPISLSKQSSIFRKPKYSSAIPSPPNSKQKISFVAVSPKREMNNNNYSSNNNNNNNNDSFLLKQKYFHKANRLKSTSNYFSFINPCSICSLKKKQSVHNNNNNHNQNSTNKSQLLLSSSEMYSNIKERSINHYQDIPIHNIKHKHVSQSEWTSRKNSLEKSINKSKVSNHNNNNKSNRPSAEQKIIIKYSKEQIKEMLLFKQFINSNKYKYNTNNNNNHHHNHSHRTTSTNKKNSLKKNNNLSSSPDNNNNSHSQMKYLNKSLLRYNNKHNYISIKNILNNNNKVLNKSNSVCDYNNNNNHSSNHYKHIHIPNTVNNSFVLSKRDCNSSSRKMKSTRTKKIRSAKNSFSSLQDINNIKLKQKQKTTSAKAQNHNHKANTARDNSNHNNNNSSSIHININNHNQHNNNKLKEQSEISLNYNMNDNNNNNSIDTSSQHHIQHFNFYKPKRENKITSLIINNNININNNNINNNHNHSIIPKKINSSLNNDTSHHKQSTSIYIQRIPTNPILSTLSSSNNDNNYYLAQSNKLIQYIKKYYSFYKVYPSTTLTFYKYGRLIGQGAFGKVNLGLNILTGRVVAIKSFNKKNLNNHKDSKDKIVYETNLMKNLNHPSIVKILEMFEDEKHMLIIMEYLNGGNLYSFVKKRRKLKEKTAKFLFWQIIQGIRYLHSMGVVHRDIKLENILIDLNNKIKICDFGIGKQIKPYKDKKSEYILYDQCGTPMYIAPEILLSTKDKGYNAYPVDMWSSGIALYIMLSGTLPFSIEHKHTNKDENNAELQYAIIHNDPKPIDNISKDAKHLLRGLLTKNPKKRFTPDDVLNHSWFRDEDFLLNSHKYHLFTKAEISVMNKTYIDYRYAKAEDIKECFTISNLQGSERDKIGSVKKRNNETKSIILAPYNTRNEIEESLMFDSVDDSELQVNDNVVVFSNKVKECNLNYELNNNGEVDNGILINTKIDTASSVQSLTQGLVKNCWNGRSGLFYESENDSKIEERRERLVEKMEMFGYDKEYVKYCLNNNELNHATAVFYLLENYDHIE